METKAFKVVLVRTPMIYGPNSKGDFQHLCKLSKITPVFPAIHNKRSMLYIDNLAEFVRQTIALELSSTSSATTFLSLIGASVANDIKCRKGNTVHIGRVSMLVVSIVVLLFAVINPPQIFWIIFFGGAIVVSAWMPVALASVLSK